MKFKHIFTGQWIEPEEWQANLRVGDYYRIDQPVAMLAPTGNPREIQRKFQVPTVYGRLESAEGCPPGYFYARGYSQWCPTGEIGLVCIVEPTRQLTQEEFEQARAAGWPVKEETSKDD